MQSRHVRNIKKLKHYQASPNTIDSQHPYTKTERGTHPHLLTSVFIKKTIFCPCTTALLHHIHWMVFKKLHHSGSLFNLQLKFGFTSGVNITYWIKFQIILWWRQSPIFFKGYINSIWSLTTNRATCVVLRQPATLISLGQRLATYLIKVSLQPYIVRSDVLTV